VLSLHRGALAANRPIRSERRSKFRFPLDLNVRFRSLSGSCSETGRAVNMSSGGVLVVSQRVVSPKEISVGALVEMSIEWPSLLDGKVPLQLCAVGWVVRRRTFDFAAAFERYQFRTSGRPIPPNLELHLS
jgi:hypothetical protein